MVGPISEDERRDAMARLKLSVVLLVGASAGLVTLSGGGSLRQVAVAVGAGLVVGVALIAYLGRIA